MKVVETEIPGVLVVEPAVYRDHRGFFLETFHATRYEENGIRGPFVQDNHSRSSRGTVRGLHAQRPPQAKLVRAIRGEIFDVAVDLRRDSRTFGRYVAASLSETNFRQLYIPAGFAHGFAVVSEFAEVEYKCTDVYRPEVEIAVRWNDPTIGIAWPIADPVLSGRDREAAGLDDVEPL